MRPPEGSVQGSLALEMPAPRGRGQDNEETALSLASRGLPGTRTETIILTGSLSGVGVGIVGGAEVFRDLQMFRHDVQKFTWAM